MIVQVTFLALGLPLAGLLLALALSPVSLKAFTHPRPSRRVSPAGLGQALAELAAGLDGHRAPPTPLLVQHGPDGTGVWLEPASAAPVGGWHAHPSGVLWERPATAPEATTCAPEPMGGLVTIGKSDEDDVVIDLCAARALSVDGPGAATWLEHAEGELRWPAEDGELVLLLVNPPEHLHGMTLDWADAAKALEVGRNKPVVLLAWTPPPADIRAHIEALMPAGQGVAAPGWTGAPWRLNVGEPTQLEPIGLDLDSIVTASVTGVPSSDPGRVDVRVLGPVEVSADGRRLDGRVAELVVYLACHPEGRTEEQLRTALWPERLISRGTFNNLVSATRRALGSTATGDPVLAPPLRGRYRLGGEVHCDLLRLEAEFAASGPADSVSELSGLRDALDAVRGHPFDGWDEGDWPLEEGLVARAQLAVESAVTRVAAAALDEDDGAVARAVGAKANLVLGGSARPGEPRTGNDRPRGSDPRATG